VLGFVTGGLTGGSPQVLDCECLGGLDLLRDEALLRSASFIVACGSNSERRRVGELLLQRQALLDTIIHPQAVISASCSIGGGTVVLAGAIIATSAELGRCCIVNHGASVDHDCKVADFANICPGAHLGGNVVVGNGALVGIGSSIIQGVKVGPNSIVGAGAVVISDVAASSTVAGVPARALARKRNPT
jgi:acetyltransferase EpsM